MQESVQARLTESELRELGASFKDLINYDSQDPTSPIDPLTYREPDGDGCLHIAAQKGDYRAMELLLKAGLDANQLGDMDCTPLHYAKMNGHNDVVDLLLRHGASNSIRNAFGKLPLDM